MDFVTQVTLGGVVGQATMNRELGNKAVLWGMLAGALPDLDVLANPLLDPVTQLTWHRGISHSLLLLVVLTPLLGWLISRIHRGEVTVEKAALFTFLAIGTHILIDLLTTYGTQILAPFSHEQFAWNVLFIIDPLFTLPLLVFLIFSLFRGEVRAKLFRNSIGIIFASAYVIIALVFKFSAVDAFHDELERQEITPQRMIVVPTPFNCILWRCVAETADGYYIGYHSFLDEIKEISFTYVPRNEQLLSVIEDQRAIRTLRWFSEGWFSVQQTPEGALYFRDLRFGDIDVGEPENSFGLGPARDLAFTFRFALLRGSETGEDQITIRREFPEPEDYEQMLEILWQRIKGLRPEIKPLGR
ncbi:metal-dependent hydrolase [bacterium]|nr:metal-dependent hydrolase [bacterium]